jgi:hypothetical protein
MDNTFDMEHYLNNSRKISISDLDFSRAKDFPLSAEEIRCLTYMMDIESHTMIYLRGLLGTCAVRDSEVVAFLSCWVYEEFFHGRALRLFLEAAGFQVDPARSDEVRKNRSWTERVEEVAAAMLCRVVSDFQALYLVWGAVQELSTLEGYGVLARRTQNPVLRDLLLRIIKDERRHFSFYFNKARLRLRSRSTQRVTLWILDRFWTPVGHGVKDTSEMQWTMRYIFGRAEGFQAARRIDSTISRLPGFERFSLLTQATQRAMQESIGQVWYYLPTHDDRRAG